MRRFPIGLTIAALAVFLILIALGTWQLRRLEETGRNRARIAALARAAPRPLATAAAQSRSDGGLDHIRVSVRCEPSQAPAPAIYRYSVADGQVAWRLMGVCRLAGPGGGALAIDRGRIAALDGAMDPRAIAFPQPASLTGVLRSPGGAALFGDDMASAVRAAHLVRVLNARSIAEIARLSGAAAAMPYYLVVESESPPPAGVTPAPVAEDVPRDNFQYALTWFGLAGALACVYAAMVWRRHKAR